MAISITVVATLMKALRISKITPFSAECILISKNNCILRAVFVTEFEAHLRHEHLKTLSILHMQLLLNLKQNMH